MAALDGDRFALDLRPDSRLRCRLCGKAWRWTSPDDAVALAASHRCPMRHPPVAKPCARCGRTKRADAFRRNRGVCRPCESAQTIARRRRKAKE